MSLPGLLPALISHRPSRAFPGPKHNFSQMVPSSHYPNLVSYPLSKSKQVKMADMHMFGDNFALSVADMMAVCSLSFDISRPDAGCFAVHLFVLECS